jgi:hypothetical protein
MVKLSRITFTGFTLFAAFLLLFTVAPASRFADLAGAGSIRSAPNLDGLLAIERAAVKGATGCHGAIIYYIYGLCKSGR